ncbi:MAG: LON peptidase substrate-binding domain-containing protein [Chloroflexi bacterium]|nr:LON peptidase substrate-binding domain-containing protein [Chloroflexota bacterium]
MFLRLFPLQALVLYPGMPLPLNVFEPRYVQLMQECMEAEEPFGVVLLQEGAEVGPNDTDPFKIGTTADIQKLVPAGGRLSVTAIGGQRFSVQSFIHDRPYLAAEVDIINDTSASLVEPSLVANVQEDAVDFVRTLMTLGGGFIRDVAFPDNPAELSYHVAQLFQGNPRVQQQLLERDTFDRLWDELSLIKSAKEQLANREVRGERGGPGSTFSQN